MSFLKEGQKVEVYRGDVWLEGKIINCRSEDHYDITFIDGERKINVKKDFIRQIESAITCVLDNNNNENNKKSDENSQQMKSENQSENNTIKK